MQINLIFPHSFWWDRGNIFDGSTTKFNSYIQKSACKNWCLYPASNDTDAKRPDYIWCGTEFPQWVKNPLTSSHMVYAKSHLHQRVSLYMGLYQILRKSLNVWIFNNVGPNLASEKPRWNVMWIHLIPNSVLILRLNSRKSRYLITW